uniref:Uncharacterized protein n=1 Tax=Tanacetum cinerariifolium TaxID=118510 RepID=A0A6L2L2V4_TANCI|nr:hypothetical protein [Tanacetum cinerariifolium]
MNYNTLTTHSIYPGTIIDWPFLADHGLELVQEFFAFIKLEVIACKNNPEHAGIYFRLGGESRILSRIMLDLLSVEPLAYVFKKKSLISIKIVMELTRGCCHWPMTPLVQVVEDDDEDEEVADDEPTLTFDSPIVQAVFIKPKPGSYAGAADASSSVNFKGTATFFQLEYENVCDGVELSIPFKVFEMLEYENVCNEVELSIPFKVFETGRSSFARCLIEVKPDDVLKESITIGILLFNGSRFSKEMSNDGFEMVVNSKKNGKNGSNSNSTNCNYVKFGGQSNKLNVKYVPKVAVSVPKKGTANVLGLSNRKNKPPKVSIINASSIGSPNDKNGGNTPNILVSNPYDALDDESEEDVENVF